MFPVCIQYFDLLKGVQNKLLAFVESAEETSMAITGLVQQSLEKHNLDEGIEFKDFEKAIEVFQLSKNVCIDDLYEEFNSHRDYLCSNVNKDFQGDGIFI
ncbi:hypothetical protein ANN_09533 [Periplaneta americana]|uniref:Uncharacterized protein n=1 Tax=Periplaneta americana TaxID=6978 RepID=A0ABQ8TNM7_PERAM|nr:hypothetical protein ANN_09533 [Periplaneta americana]